MSAAAEQLLRDNGIRLDSYTHGDHRAICPWCTPRRSRANQSDKDLNVTIDGKGVLWCCHHCGEAGRRFTNGAGNQDAWFAQTFERWHDYQKPDGEPFRRVAIKATVQADGTRKKKPTQFRLGHNGRWLSKLTGLSAADKAILYRKPQLIKAIERGETVYLVEGEKDVDTARRLGLQATCSPGGAAEPHQRARWCASSRDGEAFAEQLKGADVVVIPDHDPPGYAHALAAAKALAGVAKRVRVPKLAEHWSGDCPKGGDLSDWVEAGGTREQLEALAASTPDYDGAVITKEATVAGVQLPQWREWSKDGSPGKSMHNAMVAISAVGVSCAADLFHNKILIACRGESVELQRVAGEISDGAVIALRKVLSDHFCVDFGDKHVRDAIVCLAGQHQFDPVRDMLDQAQAAWDGTARLDNMVWEYANCANTPLNRAIMRKTMIAAVRRARRPGCKFDNITVLESAEGWNKSTFWRVLAGDENFSDESILGKSGREIQEHLSEAWIHESADLAGMRKAEVETVKAFASRQVDIARPAYGYFIKKRPRHAINVGTTNSEEYLQSQTGNRRFWPLKVLKPIDIERLKRSRLQLWGEAAKREADGESLVLDETLWRAAAAEQEKRRVRDPWEQILGDIPETISVSTGAYSEKTVTIIHRDHDKEEDFVASADLLEHVLGIPPGRQEVRDAMRLANVMRHLDWEDGGNPRTVADPRGAGKRRLRGYVRPIPKTNLL
jgi:Virulence-associated protein E